MTTCVASNESISPHERWRIFARGQRIGRECQLNKNRAALLAARLCLLDPLPGRKSACRILSLPGLLSIDEFNLMFLISVVLT